VWIAHRDSPDLNLVAGDVETVTFSPPRCIERQAARLEAGDPHVHRYEASVFHTGTNESSRAVHDHRACARLASAIEEGRDTAGAIATLFDFDSIGIEDAIEHGGVRASWLFQDQRLVESDAGMPIGQLLELFQRRLGLSEWGIEHDEIVASPVHLCEVDAHAVKNISESAKGGTVPEHTPVHDGEYAGPDCLLCRLLVDDAVLQPKRGQSKSYAIIHDWTNVLRPAEDIDDIYVLTRLQYVAEMIQVRDRLLTQYGPAGWRYRDDAIPEVLELLGYVIAGARGVCGQANNGDDACGA
jgi:hypothetical protein